MEAITPFRPSFTCDIHKTYKVVRKPKLGCIICHAMWNEKLVWLETRSKEASHAN